MSRTTTSNSDGDIPDDLQLVKDGEFPMPPNGIGPMTVMFEGLKAKIVYIDNNWNPIHRDRATMMSVVYYDGGHDLYAVPQQVTRSSSSNAT